MRDKIDINKMPKFYVQQKLTAERDTLAKLEKLAKQSRDRIAELELKLNGVGI